MGKRLLYVAAGLVLVGSVILFSPSTGARTAYFTKNLPPAGVGGVCEDNDGDPNLPGHQWLIPGLGVYAAAPAEEVIVETGGTSLSADGLRMVELHIQAVNGLDDVKGLGETQFWLDKSRPAGPSVLKEQAAGRSFPARQEMRFHFLFKTEALPGKVFRSINPAVMVSEYVTSFPPQPGATYHLQQIVELEDVADPGKVAMKVLSNQFKVGSSTLR
jgi:hypothetical protein